MDPGILAENVPEWHYGQEPHRQHEIHKFQSIFQLTCYNQWKRKPKKRIYLKIDTWNYQEHHKNPKFQEIFPMRIRWRVTPSNVIPKELDIGIKNWGDNKTNQRIMRHRLFQGDCGKKIRNDQSTDKVKGRDFIGPKSSLKWKPSFKIKDKRLTFLPYQTTR